VLLQRSIQRHKQEADQKTIHPGNATVQRVVSDKRDTSSTMIHLALQQKQQIWACEGLILGPTAWHRNCKTEGVQAF
jgi:hypothetical protein